MRLNRFLAHCGLGSRRSCEALILEGRVTVNGEICVALAQQVSDHDEVTCDDRKLSLAKDLVVALHKPPAYTTSTVEAEGRKTVYDLLPPEWNHLRYVGRLDRESEGLLLFTNQGELAQSMAHPRHGLEKEYDVFLEKPFLREKKNRLLEGFPLPEGHAKMESVTFITRRHARVILKQGLKRQIRQMFATLGCPVRRLIRIRIGPLVLDDLAPGRWRVLSETQIAGIKKQLRTR
jgi:23S rRNA pseudouridine2605 synthase